MAKQPQQRQTPDETAADPVAGPAPAAPPPAEAATAPAPDPRDDLIARLKAQLAEAQARRAAEQSPPQPARRRGLYRVSLDDAPSKQATVTVEPRDKRAAKEYASMKAASYDALGLFLAAPDLSPQEAAWRRFCAERQIQDPESAWRSFRVRVEAGPTLKALEIPAESPHDAEAIFRKFNGIEKTDRSFSTVLIDQE